MDQNARLVMGTIVEIVDEESSFHGKRAVILEHDDDGVFVAFTEAHYIEGGENSGEYSSMINVPPHDYEHIRVVPKEEYQVQGSA